MHFSASFPGACASFSHVPIMPCLIRILNHQCYNEARVISWSAKSSMHILSEEMVPLVALGLLEVLLLFHQPIVKLQVRIRMQGM